MTELGRQLAAIMFADMVGYTALMQRDEASAMAQRTRYRAVLANAVAEQGGATVQHYGDGALTIFPSAIAAVRCGMALQRALRNDEPPVAVRVGIHTGDIVRDKEGIYGDSVNIAARIQALAEPGSVLISGKVQDEVKNQPGIATRDLGMTRLKNVMRPVRVWAVEGPGIVLPAPNSISSGARVRNSVAVLPFVNLAADHENDFFSDGISEEIINALTRVRGLKVTSRTSSFSFKGKQHDLRKIAEKLGVDTVLEGSVRSAGGRVRVTAQLIDARDDTHLFSQNYDRKLDDIFAIQDEIAGEIVRELEEAIGPGEPRELVSSEVKRVDMETYTTVLRARHLWNQWSPETVLRAIQVYEHAVTLDPEYAPARSGLAAAYCYVAALGRQGHQSAYERAQEEAEASLRLDNGNADAHVALGMVALFRDWNREDALSHLSRAESLNPGSAWVHHTRAMVFDVLLDHEQALEAIDKARTLDPLSQPILRTSAHIRAMSGDVEGAVEELDHALELGPTFRTALESKGWFLAWMGRYDEALGAFSEYARLSPSPYAGATQLGYTFGRMGKMAEAGAQLERLEQRAADEPDILLEADFALLLNGMGELDRALGYLAQGIEARLGGIIFGLTSPMWARHWPDPRFKAVIASIGLWDGLEERWAQWMPESGRATGSSTS